MTDQVIVGVYGGSQVDNDGLGNIIQQFAEKEARLPTYYATTAIQLCGPESLSSQILGVWVDTTGDLKSVKAALGRWNNATCLGSDRGETEDWPDVRFGVIPNEIVGNISSSIDDDYNSDSRNGRKGNDASIKQATCKYIQTVSGDGCFCLAQKCKITQSQLVADNNDVNLCANLKLG